MEDEYNTSKNSWETRRTYERVYKVYDARGKEFLQHTTAKCAPLVPLGDIAAVEEIRAKMRARAKRRRGGGGGVAPLAPDARADIEDAMKIRHIECRGLRFCPERRMYYDRDGASARAIAGLRCLKLQGLGRPTAFRPAVAAEDGVVMV